ncbi:hypothetical protein [Halpernia sp.]|uniref:hypothetical protein n=1 Tax=Halpernia sp. TaxID=2782209 RepID=UPI003A8F159D
MDINAEKIELTKEIFKIQDIEIISKLKKTLKSFLKVDEISPMSLEQFYAEIGESLSDIEEGRFMEHSEVVERYKNKV